MSESTFGARIYTQTSISHAEIGLFNGVFCLSDGPVTSSGPWKAGMVPDNSLGDIDESIDLRDGGNIAQAGGFKIVFANAKDRASQILDDEGINLVKKYAEIIDIESGQVQAVGVCSAVSWDETDMILDFQDVGKFTNANISKQVTNADFPGVDPSRIGAEIPSTFGIIDKAKLISVSSTETPHTNNGNTAFMVSSPNNDNPTLKYRIVLAVNGTDNYDKATYIGKFLKPISGRSVGKYREIVDVTFYNRPTLGPNPNHDPEEAIDVEIKTFFEETLRGDINGKDADQTWVQIVDVKKEFVADVSELGGFVDENGALTTTHPKLFAFSDESKSKVAAPNVVLSKPFDFRLIPNYASEDASPKHNLLSFMPQNFRDNPDTVESVIILPPKDVQLFDNGSSESLYSGSTLKNWGLDAVEDGAFHTYWETGSGLYLKQGDNHFPFGNWSIDGSTNPPSNAMDRNHSTFAELIWSTSAVDMGNFSVRFFLGYMVKPPVVSEDFDFDGVYLLLAMEAGTGSNSTPEVGTLELYIRHKGWAGFAKPVLQNALGKNLSAYARRIYARDMVDSYYGGQDKDHYLYRSPVTFRGKNIDISGMSNFQLTDIATVGQFNAIKSVCILEKISLDSLPPKGTSVNMKLTEVAFAFLKSVSVKDAIFCPIKGRIYGGHWNGRKTPTDVVINPVDVLEYLDRHKNTSYFHPGRVEWGVEPTPDPRANVSAKEGGYDWYGLSAPKAQTVGFQVFSTDQNWTESIQKLICKEFFLVKYRDGRGRECVSYIADPVGVLNIDKRVTLANIPPEAKLGDVVECPPDDVASSSISLQYAKNYGNDSYGSIITINSIYEPKYRPEYVVGYDGPTKQALWERAHYLWRIYGDSTSTRDRVIPLETVRDADTALWYLQKYLGWQGKRRREITVSYDTARKWSLLSRVVVELPDMNNGNPVEAIIEQKNAQRSRGITTLGLVLFSGATGKGQSQASYSSASDSSASDSSASMSQTSKSSSSDSTSSESGSSCSTSSSSNSSDSSTPMVTDDHKHDKLWTPDSTEIVAHTGDNEFLGIGLDPLAPGGNRSVPAYPLDVRRDDANDYSMPVARITHRLTTGVPSTGMGAEVLLSSMNNVGQVVDLLKMAAQHATAQGSSLKFYTRNTGGAQFVPLKIDEDGKLCLGYTITTDFTNDEKTLFGLVDNELGRIESQGLVSGGLRIVSAKSAACPTQALILDNRLGAQPTVAAMITDGKVSNGGTPSAFIAVGNDKVLVAHMNNGVAVDQLMGNGDVVYTGSKTLAAANNLVTLLNTNDSSTITNTQLLISTKQRKAGVDYDVCSFGGITLDTYASGAHRNGGFVVNTAYAGTLEKRLGVYCDDDGGNYGALVRFYETVDFMPAPTNYIPKCYGEIHPFQKQGGGLHITGYSKYGSGITLESRNCYDGGGNAVFLFYANKIDPITGIGGAFLRTDLIYQLSDVCNGMNYKIWGDGTLTQHYPGIAHGMTSILPTDAYSWTGPGRTDVGANYGGLKIVGASYGTGPGLQLFGIGASSCSIHSMIDMVVGAPSDTGITAVAATTQALRIVNNTTELMKLYGDGCMHGLTALGVGTSTPTTAGRIQCSEALYVGANTLLNQTTLTLVGNGSWADAYFYSYSNTAAVAGYLGLYHARGSISSQASLSNGDVLGYLEFGGWTNAFKVGASINAKACAGWASGNHFPTRLEFYTAADGNSAATLRMTIGSDGGVNIASLAGSGTRAVVVDSAGNLSAP